ncbi:MAG TPA: pyruvate carboxyltransferase [Actinomycetota bacterium]|nr:pyruvate carboxyltransferase [Actinomycetota bacterium]
MANNTPWEVEGRWFTSPWNFLDASREGLAFPERVIFHDITLRDGEQQAGVALTRDDKVDIAHRLAAVGVDRIEAGMPIVSPQDEAAIKDIVQADLGPKIYAFARCMVDDIRKAQECGVTGVVVEIPSSGHIIERAYGWELDRAIKLSIEATLAAKEAGLDTVFFTINSSRAEFDWYLDLVEKVGSEGHMDALAMVDTFGGVSPQAIPVWVDKVRERLPGVRLEAHFHDDFGLAVANSIAALAAGVEVVHTTVSGIGERAGNTPMEDLALALRMLYDTDHNLVTEEFYGLSRLVRERTGHTIPTNRAVVGERLFEVESGIIAGWYERCIDSKPEELFPYHWDVVGQPPARIVYGKGSGLPSMTLAMKALGLSADDEQLRELLMAVKQRALSTKALLPFEEVAALATEHLKESG